MPSTPWDQSGDQLLSPSATRLGSLAQLWSRSYSTVRKRGVWLRPTPTNCKHLPTDASDGLKLFQTNNCETRRNNPQLRQRSESASGGWIGHTFRKPASNITRQSLDWNLQGKRKVGRMKQTWRRSADAAGTTLAKLKRTSQNRVRWRGVVAALCSTRNQEA